MISFVFNRFLTFYWWLQSQILCHNSMSCYIHLLFMKRSHSHSIRRTKSTYNCLWIVFVFRHLDFGKKWQNLVFVDWWQITRIHFCWLCWNSLERFLKVFYLWSHVLWMIELFVQLIRINLRVYVSLLNFQTRLKKEK